MQSSSSVQAHNTTTLAAEISGKITKVNPIFAAENYIREGQTLLSINKTDYLNNIELAKAEITQQQLALADNEYLNLPEHYQGEKQPTQKNLPSVTFYSNTGTKRHQ